MNYDKGIEVDTIYNESCLDTMKRMPDNYISCCVTSPPYYGLRSYSCEPSIWDGDKDCDHVWGGERKRPINLQAGNPDFQRNWRESATDQNSSQGTFCQQCNAWRGQLGLEPTFQLYLKHMIDIFREVKRVLKDDGTVWVNLGDSYAGTGSKGAWTDPKYAKGRNGQAVSITSNVEGIQNKSLLNIPYRFAIAMTDELGFIQRNQINWYKKACMPSSAKDRFTVDFEPIFFFTKSKKYWFEQQLEAFTASSVERLAQPSYDIQSGSSRAHGQQKTNGNMKAVGDPLQGRNMRTTWDVSYEPSSAEHYASYPTKLIETPITAGCPVGGIVYEPFCGTGTTCEVAYKLDRQWIGSDPSAEYCEIANKRMDALTAQGRMF